MAGGVGDVVGLGDRSVGSDQVAVPLREVGELVVRIPQDLVGRSGGLVRVGQEAEREVELLGEGLVVGRNVERDAEYGAIGVCILLGLITQALSLKRSTGGVGFGVPPEQYPVAALVRKGGRVAVLIISGEIGCLAAYLEHGISFGFGFGSAGVRPSVSR